MLTDSIFTDLVAKASFAPSADNMQPWAFRKVNNSIEVYCVNSRMLPTDVIGMFTWISIGAAIQNIVLAASAYNLKANVSYKEIGEIAAIITFTNNAKKSHLVDSINRRTTNRAAFKSELIDDKLIKELDKSITGFDAKLFWTKSSKNFKKMAYLDAHLSYIRLEHKPLHDELFEILRFSRRQNESKRFGLSFESLGVPKFAVSFAKLLQYWSINKIVSSLGVGRLVAKQLSNKLKKNGGICLITTSDRNRVCYMEAGRALQNLWLNATSLGLSIQPYGVIPQYFTKNEIETETFLAKYNIAINRIKEPFYNIFQGAENEFPSIVLRMGWAKKQSARSEVRLAPKQLTVTF